MPVISPFPYSDVNTLLADLLYSVRTILGDYFVGFYLHGSLASGDFDPGRSDIDFVVVTIGELPSKAFQELKTMHMRLTSSGSKWADRLDGDYIPLEALRRFDPDQAMYPHLGTDGHFESEEHLDDGSIQRHTLREHGIALAGPAPQAMIDPVLPEELKLSTLGILDEWWKPMLQDPGRLHSDEYQAYAIFTMCRALYTIENGSIVSKPTAAEWAKEALGNPWSILIDKALAWRKGAQMDNLNETLEFIRYTIKHTQA